MIDSALAPDFRPGHSDPHLPFTGSLSDLGIAGLYRYDDHVDKPNIGPRPIHRPAATETFETTDAMATWISTTPHERPFWRDPGFVAGFGPATRLELRAAVNELWRRAEDAARVARMPMDWPARLSLFKAPKEPTA